MYTRYKKFGELPSDLNVQDETLGPPPAWFNSAVWWPLSGLDEEVDPLQYLDEIRYTQEKNKSIPSIADRYTKVYPLSPLFRKDIAKYGFGEISLPGSMKYVAMAVMAYILFKKLV